MEQVYVTNLEKIGESIGGMEYELHRIGDWLTVIGEEIRYANAMTRLALERDNPNVAKLREQGY